MQKYTYTVTVNSTGYKREFTEREFIACWNREPWNIPFDENGESKDNYYTIKQHTLGK